MAVTGAALDNVGGTRDSRTAHLLREAKLIMLWEAGGGPVDVQCEQVSQLKCSEFRMVAHAASFRDLCRPGIWDRLLRSLAFPEA
jgi:hypothetical protein